MQDGSLGRSQATIYIIVIVMHSSFLVLIFSAFSISSHFIKVFFSLISDFHADYFSKTQGSAVYLKASIFFLIPCFFF